MDDEFSITPVYFPAFRDISAFMKRHHHPNEPEERRAAMAKIVYACSRFTRLKKRLPQIYCWKERLGTFGVWDYRNARQNGRSDLLQINRNQLPFSIRFGSVCFRSDLVHVQCRHWKY